MYQRMTEYFYTTEPSRLITKPSEKIYNRLVTDVINEIKLKETSVVVFFSRVN